MPKQPDRNLDLDERTARLAKEWFAQARQRERDEAAAQARRRPQRDGETADSLWDMLTGDGDGDGD